MLTMIEHNNGQLPKKVVWMGIENNVSNTLMLVCVKLGIKFVLCVADTDPDCIDEELYKIANDTGLVERTKDVHHALKDADFVHTDTWMNMEFFDDKGHIKQEKRELYDHRLKEFSPFTLRGKLIDEHCPNAKIMHCMPCHVGLEIDQDAVDHKNSIIIDQAENRLHAQKGILLWLLNSKLD